MMNHKGIRITLVVVETFLGLAAIGGGIAILTGVFDQWLPLEWLQGTPFSDYTIPGLVLLVVVGGGMLLAAATAFVRHEIAVLYSLAMGLVMVGWEVVEVVIIDRYEEAIIPSTIVQQILMAALGLVIAVLSAYLWLSEYRGHSLLSHHASHA